MIKPKLMKNDTERGCKKTAPSMFIYVFLTFVDSTVYNMDSKQIDSINRTLSS